MTGSIVSVFSFRNRVSVNEACEGLELGGGKLSRPVLRGPGGREPAWLLGSYRRTTRSSRVIGQMDFGRISQFSGNRVPQNPADPSVAESPLERAGFSREIGSLSYGLHH